MNIIKKYYYYLIIINYLELLIFISISNIYESFQTKSMSFYYNNLNFVNIIFVRSICNHAIIGIIYSSLLFLILKLFKKYIINF